MMGKSCLITVMMMASFSMAVEKPWRLVWSDEFDKPGLVDSSKWGYEKGFVRNKEAQYYTVARSENARVEGGRLIIEGRKEAYTAADGTKSAYTAASINTYGKFAVTYGRVEVRARLPRGRGMWPAIWMMGTNIFNVGWPKCGEIDIMENVGHNEGNVHATIHWADPLKDKAPWRHDSKGTALKNQTPWDGFHLYTVEWYEDRMDFFYDDQKYFTYPVALAGSDPVQNPFNKPHYLLINLAIGGSWGGARGIDDSIFPQRYEIDYVRIYQQ